MKLTTEINSRSFINNEAEEIIGGLASALGYEKKPLKSNTSKTRELSITRAGRTESVYVSREAGLNKMKLHVIVRPVIADVIDKRITPDSPISLHLNSRSKGNPRRFFSSNYIAFRNKGSDTKNHEHFGHAYTIDLANGFDGVSNFLEIFKS